MKKINIFTPQRAGKIAIDKDPSQINADKSKQTKM